MRHFSKKYFSGPRQESWRGFRSKERRDIRPLADSIIDGVPVGGALDEKFQPVLDRLVENLKEAGAIAQGVAVSVDGAPVIDIYAGHQDIGKTAPWAEDTIVCMMSTGKAIGAICVLMLVDRGLLSLDDKVAKHWPEFGQAGKEDISIRQVLAHLAGIPFPDRAPTGTMYDRGTIVRAIEQQEPEWAPGSTPAYHSFVIGFLIGELVRRITGKHLSDFWLEEVAGPQGIDYFLAVPDDAKDRCVDINYDAEDPFFEQLNDFESPIGRSWRPMPADKRFNSPEFRACGVANCGHGNARGLEAVYSRLLQDGAILSKAVVAEATKEVWHREDAIIGAPLRHGLGFLLSNDLFPMSGAPAFGGVGTGGSTGFADPEKGISFAFATNHAYREELAPVADWPVNRIARTVLDCL